MSPSQVVAMPNMLSQHEVEDKVAIIGAGIIGLSWAVVFARAGMSVSVFLRNEANRENVRERLMSLLESSKLLLAEDEDVVASRIRFCLTLEETCKGADYVQESVPENLSLKQDLYRQLDAIVPVHVPIGSSTSGLPMSEIAAGLPGASRCLVVHPATPPHLLPVVEIVPSPETRDDVIADFTDLLVRAGMRPVRLHKEQKGFVLNRLQVALIKEMLLAIRDGVIDPEGADSLIRDGFGLRWAAVGPLEGIDMNAPGGISDYLTRYSTLYQNRDGSNPLNAELIDVLDQSLRKRFPLDDHPDRIKARDRQIAEFRFIRDNGS